jgi:DNA polymerase (family X)
MDQIQAKEMAKKAIKLLNMPASVRVEIAGSLRRKAEVINDIDLVLIGSAIGAMPRIRAVFGDSLNGMPKMNGEIDGIRIDLLFSIETRAGAALLHLTGSKEFNIVCRARAKAFGWQLSQHGLFDSSNIMVCNCDSEIHILEMLGWEFIDPVDRAPELWRD